MTEQQMRYYKKTGFTPAVEHPKLPTKSRLEIWLDFHNHEMELIRTIVPLAVLVLQVFILVKVL